MMRVDGTIALTNRAVRVVKGTLTLTKTGGIVNTDGKAAFSLEGGALAFGENVKDEIGTLSVTAPSALALAEGATLEIDTLELGENAKLAITTKGEMFHRVKIGSGATLADSDLAKITYNGRSIVQSANGYLGTSGLVIIFR